MTTVPQDPDELDEPDLPDEPEEYEPSDVRPDGRDDANEADVVEQALDIPDDEADDYR
jgi:hypothetical protein